MRLSWWGCIFIQFLFHIWIIVPYFILGLKFTLWPRWYTSSLALSQIDEKAFRGPSCFFYLALCCWVAIPSIYVECHMYKYKVFWKYDSRTHLLWLSYRSFPRLCVFVAFLFGFVLINLLASASLGLSVIVYDPIGCYILKAFGIRIGESLDIRIVEPLDIHIIKLFSLCIRVFRLSYHQAFQLLYLSLSASISSNHLTFEPLGFWIIKSWSLPFGPLSILAFKHFDF